MWTLQLITLKLLQINKTADNISLNDNKEKRTKTGKIDITQSPTEISP